MAAVVYGAVTLCIVYMQNDEKSFKRERRSNILRPVWDHRPAAVTEPSLISRDHGWRGNKHTDTVS